MTLQGQFGLILSTFGAGKTQGAEWQIDSGGCFLDWILFALAEEKKLHKAVDDWNAYLANGGMAQTLFIQYDTELVNRVEEIRKDYQQAYFHNLNFRDSNAEDMKEAFNIFKKNKARIIKAQPTSERKLLTLPHFAYLRISDGCNNLCSYCAIPSIRGNLESIPIERLVQEAKSLAERGVKELIITAQDTANYGSDIYGKPKLVELLEQLHQIEKIEWIRLLYLHPAHITSELIDKIKDLSKICKYFEIPLQHINDEILKSMNRKVTKERIKEIISLVCNNVSSGLQNERHHLASKGRW